MWRLVSFPNFHFSLAKLFEVMKMFSLKAESFYESSKPLHFFSQLIGLCSFTVQKDKEIFKVIVTNFNILCLVSSTSLLLFTSIIAVSSLHKFSDDIEKLNTSDVFETSTIFNYLVFLFVAIASNWWIFFSRKSFGSIAKLFSEIDNELNKMKLEINFSTHKKRVWSAVLCSKIFTVIEVLNMLFYTSGENFTFVFAMVVGFSILAEFNYFLVSNFFFMMYAVKLRYEKINFFLSEKFLSSKNFDGQINDLNIVAKLHDKLVDVSELINKCYGLPVRRSN